MGGPWFDPRSGHAVDFKIDPLVASLLDAWRHGVSARTGWPRVPLLVEIARSICIFYLGVAAHKVVQSDPSPRYSLPAAKTLSNLGPMQWESCPVAQSV